MVGGACDRKAGRIDGYPVHRQPGSPDGRRGPGGGLADVYLDGAKQLAGIDYWNPKPRTGQVVYYRNGLSNEEHALKIVALGRGNPYSQGTKVSAGPVFSSAATGSPDFGEGGGPTDAQRMVFGYPGREDLKDSAGHPWRPGTEFVIRSGSMKDSVAESWWTTPAEQPILGTKDPDLYRYGVHGREFWVNVTVGPGTYGVRLKFAAARVGPERKLRDDCDQRQRSGPQMDVAATAGGPNARHLVFGKIAPRNGVIDIRFTGGDADQGVFGEAFVQAIVGPDVGGQGAARVRPGAELLRDGALRDRCRVWRRPGGQHRVRRFPARSGQHAAEPRVGAKTGGSSQRGQAARRCGSRQGQSRLVQEVAVRPKSVCRGSAWVLARDEEGSGFGRASDSAGVILEELDAGATCRRPSQGRRH